MKKNRFYICKTKVVLYKNVSYKISRFKKEDDYLALDYAK